jgi:hypothetical protein
MKKLKVIAIGLLAGLAVTLPPPAQAGMGMKGAPHDFTATTNFWVGGTNNWVPNNNLCEVCHVVHKAPAAFKTAGPLWNHNLSANTWTPFTSPRLTVDGYPSGGTPGYSSLACLSCHDGSVAINQLGGSASPTGGTAIYVPSWAKVAVNGTDLSGTHPIGISYDTILASGDTFFQPVTTTLTDAGNDSGVKTIAQDMLFQEAGAGANMIECASCHDIHQVKGASATAKDSLIVGADGVVSSLCITCHIK